ncbi:OsmC family protein [Methylobacterium sp. E-016]|jgi:uncharacterized OsmC-like protein|uniref:OsmC family protein n=1 Tax=Methylobacterium sp. E-016 TaxID=2836556 RepID=UPI001FBA49F2|nr:OsmC family protein [Methylobacterium sp. E-016]MCJ2079652.1 OsmC family protein [Methylobacterium sp. E-016]
MTDLNPYLAQKRTALDDRRARIERGAVGPVALRAEARIEGRSGVRRIRIREHAVISDSLPDFAGYDLGPGSPELQLGVLGSCLAHSFLIQAAAHGVPLDSLSVEVTATFDPRAGEAGYADVPVHPQDLAYTIRVASPASEAEIAALHDRVDRACPILNLLRGPQAIRGRIARITA